MMFLQWGIPAEQQAGNAAIAQFPDGPIEHEVVQVDQG